MFRFLFRFAGLVVIALSFLFVVYDGTKSIADQKTYSCAMGGANDCSSDMRGSRRRSNRSD